MIDVVLSLFTLLLDGLSVVFGGRRRFDFRETVASESGGFALGVERRKNQPYLEIRVRTRLGTGREHYRLTPDEYERFVGDHATAAAFAAECRNGTHDDRRFVTGRRRRG